MKVNSFLARIKPVAIGTSMADLALLLLIFFMVSTTTEPPQGSDVSLPVATTSSIEQEGIYISISGNGDIYYDGKKTTPQDLYDSLAMRRSERNKLVSITADRGLEYRHISRTLDMLRELDFLNVAFMAHQRPE